MFHFTVRNFRILDFELGCGGGHVTSNARESSSDIEARRYKYMINGHLASEAQLNVAGMDWKKVNTIDESCLRSGHNVDIFRFLKNIHIKLDF